MKLCLKSLQEYVRLQTFNRSGFQQIQLDIQFLKAPLKETVEDEAAIDFLLDEVIYIKAFPSLFFEYMCLTIHSSTVLCVFCTNRWSLRLRRGVLMWLHWNHQSWTNSYKLSSLNLRNTTTTTTTTRPQFPLEINKPVTQNPSVCMCLMILDFFLVHLLWANTFP